MPPTLRDLGLDRLSLEDRLALAQALFDSVKDDLEARPLSPELRAELERRLALADAALSRGLTWEAVPVARAQWQR